MSEPVHLDVDHSADPFPLYERLRRDGGVHPAVKPNGDPVWLITRYQDVRALLPDSRLALSKRHARDSYQPLGLPPALDENLLNLDPPDHTRLRRLVMAAFTARRVEAMRPRIHAAVGDLLDRVQQVGRADLVADVAAPLPMTVICDLIGVPDEDGAAFRSWTTDLLSPHQGSSSKVANAIKNLHELMLSLIARKRAAPTDDLVSSLLAARDGNDRLTEDELISQVFILLLAGYENSVNFIANAVLALLDRPDAAARLAAEPGPNTPLLAAAVEELLRHDAPALVSIRRFPVEPLTVGAVTIPAGDTVLLGIGSANRDPDVFTDPDRLDIDRYMTRNAAGHVSLGHGIHFCLGAALARSEAQIAIWTLLRRYPDLTLAIPREDVRWCPDFRQRALVELPVTFTPTPAG